MVKQGDKIHFRAYLAKDDNGYAKGDLTLFGNPKPIHMGEGKVWSNGGNGLVVNRLDDVCITGVDSRKLYRVNVEVTIEEEMEYDR
jgi:hypothetical protein